MKWKVSKMGVNYNKLFKILDKEKMTKTQFREALGISTSTLAKISSNRPVTLDIIERICIHFDVKIESSFFHDKFQNSWHPKLA